MVLLDGRRRHVEVNGAFLRQSGYRRDEVIGKPAYQFVVGGPLMSAQRWAAALGTGSFDGEGELRLADGGRLAVHWAATVEVVTGDHLVLFVELASSRRARRLARPVDEEREPASLSAREREVVRRVALGETGREIALELQISYETVRTHVRNAMSKSGARSRAHLVAKALGEGLGFD
jgi:PAS domain S-box-containing protein